MNQKKMRIVIVTVIASVTVTVYVIAFINVIIFGTFVVILDFIIRNI